MSEEDLADVSVDDERPTAICDPNPGNAYLGAPESPILCGGGLQLGFRAIRTRLASVERLYLHRSTCAAELCTQAELNLVTVIGWLGSDAYSVVITVEPNTITVPAEGAAYPWPTPTSSVSPPIRRPTIDGAPGEIRRRVPYPFCGREKPTGLVTDRPGDYERALAINRCFFDAILEGRPVEMIMITEVTREPVVLRFDGSGFVTRYMQEGGDGSTLRAWYRRAGCETLGSSVYWGLECGFEPVRVD